MYILLFLVETGEEQYLLLRRRDRGKVLLAVRWTMVVVGGTNWIREPQLQVPSVEYLNISNM